ncbi:hypothetical protein ET495_12925 [Xylanimonas allomyrinae]|uniref:Uncharacterized protein n=1 Tax=Xylanimonas allomyrinae TaxID=2509459 RepID=A0A4P6EMT3_9MICO|nr:hypothetical protein [Xylanimonas allomyrinae]QAY63982.1 hypothetical protein ET495_12925 [Xylanimonas allomyrinae]
MTRASTPRRAGTGRRRRIGACLATLAAAAVLAVGGTPGTAYGLGDAGGTPSTTALVATANEPRTPTLTMRALTPRWRTRATTSRSP